MTLERHSIVKLNKDTVEKITAPELMRIEVEKTHRAWKIGKDCGLFSVPEVIDYDETEGRAVFRRLQITPVSEAYPWGERKIEAADRLGRSLAVIHRELVLPNEMRIPLPEPLLSPCDEVYLHGDLSVSNVCSGGRGAPIVIIDWQMTPLYGGRATYGTRYFDIMWFIGNLIGRPNLRFVYSNPVAPVARAFLRAYFATAGVPYDARKIAAYASGFFAVEMPRVQQEIYRYSRGKSRMLLPFCHSILTSFMKSLTRHNYP